MFLGEDVDFEDDLEKLSYPIGEEDDEESYQSTSYHVFAAFLGLFVSGAC